MNITEQTLISDIAAALPASVRVFQRVGIDFCCGGNKPLGKACEEHRLSFRDVARQIETSAAAWPSAERDWSEQSLSALIDHIVTVHHAPLREQMPRIESMAARVLRVHGGKAPRLLGRIEAIVLELSADLNDHLRKEELILFPAIRRMETGELAPRAVPISSPIRALEYEHDAAGDLLAELRTITNVYVPPDWACDTTRALYAALAELERDMQVHVHLENNILFPGALRLARIAVVH